MNINMKAFFKKYFSVIMTFLIAIALFAAISIRLSSSLFTLYIAQFA